MMKAEIQTMFYRLNIKRKTCTVQRMTSIEEKIDKKAQSEHTQFLLCGKTDLSRELDCLSVCKSIANNKSGKH